MKIMNTGSVHWTGAMKTGRGSVSTKSGALQNLPYGFASRFEGQPGTNPEELLAASHAACFTMALSRILGESNLTAEWMDTSATVTLEQLDGAWTISAVHLMLRAKISSADDATFSELAAKAKAGCPVSRALNAAITLDAALVQ
jgi:osmotically inducible protein OsmC